MSTRGWLLSLIICGVVLRIGLWWCYEPIPFPDTGTYVRAAEDLLAGEITREGRRTPGYPLLIALSGTAPWNIVTMQMIVGIATSVALFYVALLMTGRAGFAFGAGMTYNLNLQQLFVEATLLSETASTFTVVLVVLALLRVLHGLRACQPVAGGLLLLGVLSGVSVLTRPQFVFLPLLLPILVGLASTGADRRFAIVLRDAALVGVPGVLFILGWCAVVYAKVGFFTLSTQSGLGLVNHSAAFVEHAPDRYATIRDILLKHRETKVAEQGHAGNTIWNALPEIREATGLSLPEVSREVQRMSLELFAQHPLKYGMSVARGWVEFWTVPNLAPFDRINPPWARPLLEAIWWVEHKFLRIANLVFVLLTCLVVVSVRARRRTGWDLDMTAISAVILAASILQALAEYGSNSRYAVPIQPLVVLVVLVAGRRTNEPDQSAVGLSRNRCNTRPSDIAARPDPRVPDPLDQRR